MCREARNNEWDIFITESGTWCYRFAYRFPNVKERLGNTYKIIYTTDNTWLSSGEEEKQVCP
ncbi:hypothetical protein [Salmonella phage SP-3]|uniref:Uncharacterized protein n=1 Tax=Salmonella phage SP-3 TaxID=1186124 RepID=A0A2H4PIJ4_9CAUD|nr:hypothetical protein HOT55_gp101 [Salmonella phage SP3]ATW62622.1 hypothetical protein [Salmonella phage SP3]